MTFVYSSELPCDPAGVPPVEAPWTRCQIELIDRAVYRSTVLDEDRRGAP